ncbi:MAG: YbhB/YbcL family Raf kinase inhibitor-like protein [Patescibacteria group bacterium]
MRNLTSGIILVLLALIAVWVFWPTQEHTPVLKGKNSMQELKLTSDAFTRNGLLPSRFTCDAKAPMSPPLAVSGIPAGTNTLALILHDPDAPRARGFTHWVRFNIPWNMNNGTWTIQEGKEPEGTAGKGSANTLAYYPPCPPTDTHRYIFTIYALDAALSLGEGATKTEVEAAMQGHVLGKGELTSLYSRPLRLSQ